MSPFAHTRVPELDGATEWLNSEPLGHAELRGHVVLFDFWTLTCINWLRTAPYIRAWSRAYRDDGLIVVGVHTPEFSFEHDVELVRLAIEQRAIEYPVVVDNDYAIWSAFANQYWPALYFADREGVIRDEHFGEGRYEHLERVIQRLLGVDRDLVSVAGQGVEAEADWSHLCTPETYLGALRGERYDDAGDAERLRAHHWTVGGDWRNGSENIALDGAGGSIAFRFHARDAHAVLNGGGRQPIPFRVTLDGEAPGAAHGVDVDEDGCGVLREGRLYQLIRVEDGVRDRTLRVVFDAPGAAAYAFTFG